MVEGVRSRRPVTVNWRSAAVAVFPIWLTIRLVVAILELIVLRTRIGPALSDRAASRVPDLAGNGYFALLLHWDSNYFLSIAVDGYFPSSSAPQLAAYFPGYPFAARAAATVLGTMSGSTYTTTVAVSMWLISTVASLVGALVLWRLLMELAPQAATIGVVLLLAGPYSIFLYAGYSESLFLAFALAAWYAAVTDRWWWAGGWCALATATRINGVFLLAALLVLYLDGRRREGAPILDRALLWVPLAAVGVVAYFGYLYVRTGDLLAWSHAQSVGWNRSFSWPWDAFRETAGRVLFAATADRQLQFALDIVAATLVTVALLVWLRRRDWPEALYAGLTLIALTTSTNFVSLARNTIVVFPLVVLLAVGLVQARRWVRRTVLVCWTGLFIVNATLFAFGYWTD